jgi:hypothetical protein
MQYMTHAIPFNDVNSFKPEATPLFQTTQHVLAALIRQPNTEKLLLNGFRRVDVFGKAYKTKMITHQPDDFVLGLELVPITGASVDVTRRKRYDYNELKRGSYPETRDLQTTSPELQGEPEVWGFNADDSVPSNELLHAALSQKKELSAANWIACAMLFRVKLTLLTKGSQHD